MKQYLITFAAVLSAIVVGSIGYEWYKDYKAKQDQGYRTAAYLSQGAAVAAAMKVATDGAFQYDGKFPCSAEEYAAIGFRPPSDDSGSVALSVDVTGCGEFRLTYKAFDGTPAGQIVLQATENSESYGSSVKWTCTSPSYMDVERAFPGCTYDGSTATLVTPVQNTDSPKAADEPP